MSRLVIAEFRKLFTTWLWLWLLVAALAIVGLLASLDIALGDQPGSPSPPLSTVEGQHTLVAVAGMAATLAAVLGAVGMTGEYRYGTASPTFLATPHRWRVVLAKLITYAIVGAGYGLASIAMVAAIAVPWLGARGIELHGEGMAGVVLGNIAAVALFAMLGVALGALLREQVATVVSLLIYLFVVENILTNLSALESWSVYLPGAARDALTGVTKTHADLLSPAAGGVVLVVYAAALAVTGLALSVRRDVR